MKRIVLFGSALILGACGMSEDEHRRLLDAAQAKLNAQHDQALQAEKSAATKRLEDEKQRVALLEAQLKKLGVELQSKGAALEQEGSAKAELAARNEQLAKALEEFKARAAQLERIKERFETLKKKLEKLTEVGLKVEIRNNRMVIRLPGDVLFPSGSDELKPEGKKVVRSVCDVIRGDAQLKERYFQIAGHTDDKPFNGGPFRDNWGLSVMRARNVLVFMTAAATGKEPGGGLGSKFMHAAGYGDTDPVVANKDDKTRQQNRRVELVMMPNVEEMLDLKSL